MHAQLHINRCVDNTQFYPEPSVYRALSQNIALTSNDSQKNKLAKTTLSNYLIFYYPKLWLTFVYVQITLTTMNET